MFNVEFNQYWSKKSFKSTKVQEILLKIYYIEEIPFCSDGILKLYNFHANQFSLLILSYFEDIECWEYPILKIFNVEDVQFWKCSMLKASNFIDVQFWICIMLKVPNFEYCAILKIPNLKMFNVEESQCWRSSIWWRHPIFQKSNVEGVSFWKCLIFKSSNFEEMQFWKYSMLKTFHFVDFQCWCWILNMYNVEGSQCWKFRVEDP